MARHGGKESTERQQIYLHCVVAVVSSVDAEGALVSIADPVVPSMALRTDANDRVRIEKPAE